MTGIVISGASRGLGAALALRFAAPGARLLLIARDAAALTQVAAACAAGGAVAEVAAIDVTDAAAMEAAVLEFDRVAPVRLVIANAGAYGGTAPDGTPEQAAAAARLVAVNLLGAMHLVGPLLPAMRARRAGAVALVGSLAGLRGLPDAPGYSAAKAGLLAWGEALRAAEAPHGITVTVLAPGFFASRMGDRHQGGRPLALSLDQAADRVAAAIRAGRGRAAFPWPLALLLRLLALLPPALGDWAIRRLRFRIRPEA